LIEERYLIVGCGWNNREILRHKTDDHFKALETIEALELADPVMIFHVYDTAHETSDGFFVEVKRRVRRSDNSWWSANL
jgi:hypothetical protein